MTIKIPPDIQQWCEQIAHRRNDWKERESKRLRRRREYNSGHAFDDNLISVKAEWAVGYWLDCLDMMDVEERRSGDGGIDLWKGDVPIDVKATRHLIDGLRIYPHHYSRLKTNPYKFQYLVFVNCQCLPKSDHVEILGWITWKDFLNHWGWDVNQERHLVKQYNLSLPDQLPDHIATVNNSIIENLKRLSGTGNKGTEWTPRITIASE